jgi:hypothetical protein
MTAARVVGMMTVRDEEDILAESFVGVWIKQRISLDAFH